MNVLNGRPNIRPLTGPEIDSLERALGAPVDREYLIHWVSVAISDAVILGSQPSGRRVRDSLLRTERAGRVWLQAMDESEAASLLADRADLLEFRTAAARFCDRVATLAKEADTVVRGHPRTSFALEQFIDRMIGIAKRANVLPSTPSRRKKHFKVRAAGHEANRKRAQSPAFFEFIKTAIRLALTVIRTSSLPDEHKASALSKMRVQSLDALNKIVVKVRRRVGNYRHTAYGLVEFDRT